MQTLKEIVGRERDSGSLRDLAISVVAVLVLFLLFFGGLAMNLVFKDTPKPSQQQAVSESDR